MSKYNKVIAGFVGFATAVTMSFGTASAATTEELQAQITALLAQITSLQAQLGTTQTGGTTVGAYTFATDLQLGSTGTDVMNLQKVLNSNPATLVSATGAGSIGLESTYFGAKTKSAVMKFQTLKGITPVAGYVGPKTRAILNTMGGTTGTLPPVVIGSGTTLSVALSFDNPAAGTLIAGQAVGDLAHFTFSNPTGVEQKVTKLTLNRTGISNDATLVNVYLFEGAKRITDSASISSSKVVFNDTTGLFTIPAGGMKTISVKADILSTATGQVIGISLGAAEGSVAVAGAFPILGNNHSIATATMAGVNFAANSSPISDATVDPQTEFAMWSNIVSFTTRAVNMHSITFRQIGSVANADLGNFKLYVDGTQVGTTIASLDANGYVNFDLTASPKAIATGSHTIKLVGDIIGGSTKTFSFSLQQAGDAVFMDSQLNQPVLAQAASGVFSARTTGTMTVSGGTLTITKKTDSPAGNVTLSASNALLAKFELKAAGEPMKVENLRVGIYQSAAATYTSFSARNGALFILKADGTEEQIGNTNSILGNNDSTLGYTEFSLGSSLVVMPGTPVTLLVRADIYNDDAAADVDPACTDDICATDTLKVRILAGSNNVKKVSSLTYTANTAVSANTLTVASGSLSGSKNASYANQTIVKPQTNIKLASFNIVSTETENLNLDTIALTFTGTQDAPTSLSDVYVKYGSKTTSVKSTVATSTSSWSISETMAPNTTMAVEVWGNLTSSLASGQTVITGVTISGTSAASGTAVSTDALTGQTLTISTGTFTGTAISDSSLSTKLLVGNTSPKLASFRILTTNDTYTITDVSISVTDSDNAKGAFNSFTLKAAGMTDRIITLNGHHATSSAWTLAVPANSSTGVVVDVYGNLATVGNGAATTTDLKVTLEAVKGLTSGGTEAYATLTSAVGQSMYAYASLPTISLVSLPSTSLVGGGEKAISKFTISADSAGAIGWKKMTWAVTKTAGVLIGTTTTGTTAGSMNLKDSHNNIIAGTFSTSTTGAAVVNVDGTTYAFEQNAVSGTLTFIATSEQEITTSETYSLYTTVSGDSAAGENLTTSIGSAGSYAAPNTYAIKAATAADTFIWTDRAMSAHSVSTADWNNDYKVTGLPTTTQSLAGAS